MYNIAEILYANVCTHVCKLNVLDDKKNSWCAPGDCTGKVFVKIRELNRNHQDTSDLSYADVEHFTTVTGDLHSHTGIHYRLAVVSKDTFTIRCTSNLT